MTIIKYKITQPGVETGSGAAVVGVPVGTHAILGGCVTVGADVLDVVELEVETEELTGGGRSIRKCYILNLNMKFTDLIDSSLVLTIFRH